MDDTITVAVVERTGYLARELAGLFFLELAVRDDVVKHLTTIDILKQHIPVVVCTDNIPKSTNVGVVEEGDDSCLACSTDLLGLVGALLIGAALMAIVGGSSRNDFACNLMFIGG